MSFSNNYITKISYFCSKLFITAKTNVKKNNKSKDYGKN